MLSELLDRLNHEWLPAPLAEPLSVIKAAGSVDHARKVNFIVFANRADSPSVLIKVMRERASQTMLADEYDRLEKLYAHPALQGRIPSPVGLFWHNEMRVMVETCLPGTALGNLLRRKKRHSQAEMAADLGHVRDWLIDFQCVTAEDARPFLGPEEVEKRLTGSGVSLSPRLVSGLMSLAGQARGVSVPLTARHGDFWPGNILIGPTGCGVIDWETVRFGASPFDDLFFFATTYAHDFSAGMNHLERFRMGFVQDTALSRALSDLVHSTVAALGVSPGLSALFFVLFLWDASTGQIALGRTGESELNWHGYLSQLDSLDDLVMFR
jgi:hypothetical protein